MDLQEGPQVLLLSAILFAVLVWVVRFRRYLVPMPEVDPEAEIRALSLLTSLLNEKEQEQIDSAGYLAVPSPTIRGRVYRVPNGPGWVDVYEAGRLSMKLCVEPTERLPAADVVVMHKLMIEGNEREYLREANVVYVRPPDSARWHKR